MYSLTLLINIHSLFNQKIIEIDTYKIDEIKKISLNYEDGNLGRLTSQDNSTKWLVAWVNRNINLWDNWNPPDMLHMADLHEEYCGLSTWEDQTFKHKKLVPKND